MAILEVNTLHVFDTVEDARRAGQAIALILGDEKGIRVRDGQLYVSLVAPTFDRSKVTRGRQEAEATVNKIATKASAMFDVPREAFVGKVNLDETVGEWNVNYKALVQVIRDAYPGDTVKMADFQGLLREVIAEEALRGVSFK